MTHAALKVKSILQVDDLGWWQEVLLNIKTWCLGKSQSHSKPKEKGLSSQAERDLESTL